VNVCEALWPLLNVPVLKLPSFAVAVCELGPSLVQVIVSPTWTVVVGGVKWKSAIVTAGSEAECAIRRRATARCAGGPNELADTTWGRPSELAAATWRLSGGRARGVWAGAAATTAPSATMAM
jgi:hypothetical protein